MISFIPPRVVACVLTLFAIILFLPQASAQALVRVMPLGDSITYGMGAGPQQIPGGYRDPLARAYAAAGASFMLVGSDAGNATAYLNSAGQQQNEGHTGYRIDQIQASMNAWQASAAPDVVLLHLGTNDILQTYNLGTGAGYDTSAAVGRLTTLITGLYANKPDLKVVLSTLIPIQDNRDLYVKNYNAALAQQVIPHFQGIGRAIVLVDNYANFVTPTGEWNTTLFADYAHPNAAGYAAMAATYAAVPLPVVEGITFTPATASTSSGKDSALAVNLITAGQSTLAGVTAPTGSLSGTFPVAGLNDGSVSGNANFTYYSVTDALNGAKPLPATVTFQLDTSVNTGGYDITSVQVLSGWGDHNLGAQRFQLLLSRNNQEFVGYGTFSNAAQINGGNSSFLSTVSHSTGLLASHVTGIRFVFLNPDPASGENATGPSQAVSSGGTVIRELQAFGTPSAPEPLPPCILTAAATAGAASQDSAIAVNLLRQGQSSLTSVSAPAPGLPANFKIAGLNDGSAAANANMTFYSVTDTSNGSAPLPAAITFELNTTTSPAGYDISSIQAITGWGDHTLGGQRFQLLLSLNHGEYADYGTYRNAEEANGGNTGYRSTLTARSGSVIASHVTGIRFVFLNPDISNGVGSVGTSQAGGGSTGGTVIRELQAFGTPSTTAPEPYAAWAAGIWQLTGDDALPEADPNGNGIRNLLEYALGGDPAGATTGVSILPSFSRLEAGGKLSFTRYQDRTDLTLSVEASTDLAAWTEIARSTGGGSFASTASGVTVQETGDANAVPVTITESPAAGTPVRFLRLKVSQN